MKRVAVILLAGVVLIGCGSSDPNEAVANNLIQRGVIDDLCYHVHVHGRQDVVNWLVWNVSFGKPAWADRHIFLNGATPQGVTADLLSHCLPDGSWTLDEH
jgi:hypothetical protein